MARPDTNDPNDPVQAYPHYPDPVGAFQDQEDDMPMGIEDQFEEAQTAIAIHNQYHSPFSCPGSRCQMQGCHVYSP